MNIRTLRHLLTALLLPVALPVHAQSGGEPLQPDEAFALQADADRAPADVPISGKG